MHEFLLAPNIFALELGKLLFWLDCLQRRSVPDRSLFVGAPWQLENPPAQGRRETC